MTTTFNPVNTIVVQCMHIIANLAIICMHYTVLYVQIPLLSCAFDLSVYKTKVIQLCTIIHNSSITVCDHCENPPHSYANFDVLIEIQNVMTPLLFLLKLCILVDK